MHQRLYRDEIKEGRNYIISVETWQDFHQIVRNVNTLLKQENNIDFDLITPEFFADLWYQTLWNEIIYYFYDYHSYNEYCRKLLEPVRKYVQADDNFNFHPRQQAKIIFEDSRKAIKQFLNERSSKLYFLFDSLERYHLRNPTFIRIIQGLFRGLAKINDESPRVVVAFCIPEEFEPFIASESANIMKDFASSYRIRWRPVDLIRVIAHRLRISAYI